MKRRALAVLAALLAAQASSAPARGSVYVVNSTADNLVPTPSGCRVFERAEPAGDLGTAQPTSCTLRDAVTAANAHAGNDEIIINLAGAQVLTLLGTLEIDEGVEINAAQLAGWTGQVQLTSLNLVAVTGVTDLLKVTAGDAQLRDLVLRDGDVNVVAGRVVFVQTTGSATFEQDISGAGALEKDGAGTLILTGTNSYTGLTTISQGSLQGNTLSIPGGTQPSPQTVTDNAKLVFDQAPSDPADFFGKIGGTGSLEKIGDGTLFLRSLNTYTGGTTITKGTLQGFVAPTGSSLQGDIVDNAKLVFVQDADGTFADDISGSGNVEKTGVGTLTLSGTNTFTGGLAISQGVVIGSSKSIPGAVSLAAQADDGMGGMIPSGAQVIFDQAGFDGTNSGGITGGGGLPAGTPTLIKRGTGLLILGGNNSYTGGTRLEAGTLQGTTSSLQGDIVDLAGTTLTFSQSSSGSYTGVIDGPGALVKQGSGTVSFTRTQSLDPGATTTIQGGRLVIGVAGQGDMTGTTLQESVAVQAAGTLSGVGTVGGAVTNSGTIAPGGATSGDAVGTLTVGSVTFGAGSTLSVNAGDAGTDLLKATGAADLGTNALLHVDLGRVDRSTVFTQPILDAASIAGSPFTINETFAFFDATTTTSPTTVSLVLSPNGKLLPDFATTRNEQAVGQALEDAFAVAAPGGDLDSVFDELGGLSTAELPKALNDMTGEQLTEFATTRLAIANRFQSSLQQRVRGVAWGDGEALISQQGGAPPVLAANPLLLHGLPGVGQGFAQAGAAFPLLEAQSLSMQGSAPSFGPAPGELGLGGWIDGYGLFGKLSGDSDTADLDYRIGGFSLGIDYRLTPHWLLGIAGGYAYTSLDFQGLTGSQTANTGQGALYGGYVTPWLQIGASGRFGYSAMTTSRDIEFNDRNADGDFNGWDAGARVDAALDVFRLGPVEFQPIASFSYTHVQQDSFDESGANSLDLAVDEQTIDSLVSGVGGRIHGALRIDEKLWFHPELRAAWLHEFGDRDRELTARIGGVPGGGFDVRGAEPSADTGVFGLSWTVVVDGRLHAFLGYDVSVSSALIEHSATLGFKTVW